MPPVRFLLKVVDAVSDFIGKLVSFLMSAAIGVLVYAVWRRYFAHDPWRYEAIATNFFVTYVMMGAAYSYRNGAFIHIDILYRRLSVRARAVVSIFTSVMFFIFLLVFMQWAMKVALVPPVRFSSRLIAPAGWPVRLIYPAGVSLLILQGLGRFVRDLVAAVTGKELK